MRWRGISMMIHPPSAAGGVLVALMFFIRSADDNTLAAMVHKHEVFGELLEDTD